MMIIEDTFWLRGRGLVITGSVKHSELPPLDSPVHLVRPDEKMVITTTMAGIEKAATLLVTNNKQSCGILLRGFSEKCELRDWILFT